MEINEERSSLDEDWVLPLEWRAWSLQFGMTNEEIDVTEIKFKNYWLSTTKNAAKKDWYSVWKNWCATAFNTQYMNSRLKI